MSKSTYSRKYRRFCESLARARREAGLSQEEVARRLSKPQSYVSKFESAERRLDMIEFLDVADAIGVDPVQFVRRLRQEA